MMKTKVETFVFQSVPKGCEHRKTLFLAPAQNSIFSSCLFRWPVVIHTSRSPWQQGHLRLLSFWTMLVSWTSLTSQTFCTYFSRASRIFRTFQTSQIFQNSGPFEPLENIASSVALNVLGPFGDRDTSNDYIRIHLILFLFKWKFLLKVPTHTKYLLILLAYIVQCPGPPDCLTIFCRLFNPTGGRLCPPHKLQYMVLKVHIFWEGHNILQNLHLTFVCMSLNNRKVEI